jgi:putative lipoprotein
MHKSNFKNKFRKKIFTLVCGIIFFGAFTACSKKGDNFQHELTAYDEYAAEATRDGSLARLQKLRAKAKTPEAFLSVAKREYNLQDKSAAFQTALKGAKVTEDNRVIALLVQLAVETESYESARPYFSRLYGTAYESFAVEFALKSTEKPRSRNLDYAFLMSAFYETGVQAFLVDAALAQISNGRLKDALTLRAELKGAASEYPYFWSVLAFDLGYFSVIFDELPYTLAQYDADPENQTLLDNAKAHILLAADGHYGLGETELARAYWTEYADRFSDANPAVFYDLALTGSDFYERSKALVECVKNFPDFYPATARYVRDYAAYRDASAKTKKSEALQDAESVLEKSGLYSADMEAETLQGQFFTLEPETLLKEKAATSKDCRFALELLRLKIKREPNFQKYRAEIWQILESNPNDATAREFAKWYFCNLRDFDTAFSVAETGKSGVDAFYAGVHASIVGDTEKALASYEAAFGTAGLDCAARVNYACTKALLGESADAIDGYTEALNYASDDSEKSRIHFRIAEILVELQQYERAKGVLQYAIQLDSQNYLAESLLQQLR